MIMLVLIKSSIGYLIPLEMQLISIFEGINYFFELPVQTSVYNWYPSGNFVNEIFRDFQTLDLGIGLVELKQFRENIKQIIFKELIEAPHEIIEDTTNFFKIMCDFIIFNF